MMTRKPSKASMRPHSSIGHLFGGLIVQFLLDRGLGRLEWRWSPALPKGILVCLLVAERGLPAARASVEVARHRALLTRLEEFTLRFATRSWAEAAGASCNQRDAVPEKGQIFLRRAGLPPAALPPGTC